MKLFLALSCAVVDFVYVLRRLCQWHDLQRQDFRAVQETTTLHQSLATLALILTFLLSLTPANSFADTGGAGGGSLYIIDRGVAVALRQTSLRPPALLHVPVNSQTARVSADGLLKPLRSISPAKDSDGVAVVDLYVQSTQDLPELICHSFVRSGDYSGDAETPVLELTKRGKAWRGRCRVLPGTAMMLVQITKPTQANTVYGLSIGDEEQTLNDLLRLADMEVVVLLDIARTVLRGYPNNKQAKTVFSALSPFRHHTVNRANHRLLDQSADQFRKQEKHSFDLAMRNGINGRGYRLQDYLRDYPDGRYSVKALVEIPKRKRALFKALPRWAEQRAESVLRIVLQWQDSERKVDALNKYVLAYPHGRVVSIVRSEIGRIGNYSDRQALTDQMTAKNMH